MTRHDEFIAVDGLDEPTNSPWRRRVAGVMLALLGCVLAWAIVTRSLAQYLGAAAPELSLKIAPGNSGALIEAAEQQLRNVRQRIADRTMVAKPATGPSAARAPAAQPASTSASAPDPAAERRTLDEVKVLAERALESNPLSSAALRILGEVATIRGEPQRADAMLSAAIRLRKHETMAMFLRLQRKLAEKDYATVIETADALFRTHPELTKAVAPFLVQMIESGGGKTELGRVLAGNPPWRHRFVNDAMGFFRNAKTPLELFQVMQQMGTPPNRQELGAYLNLLMGNRLFEMAYYTWLQFLTPEQLAKAGFLYNGDFSFESAGHPMDWNFRNGPGHVVELTPHDPEGKDRAIRVELGPGRVQFVEIYQWLFLPPGGYVLSGKSKGEVNGRKSLKWQIACADVLANVVGESAMLLGNQRVWRDFEVGFRIPDTGCKQQKIQLVHDARHSGEQFVNGIAWYDDLRIVRR